MRRIVGFWDIFGLFEVLFRISCLVGDILFEVWVDVYVVGMDIYTWMCRLCCPRSLIVMILVLTVQNYSSRLAFICGANNALYVVGSCKLN